MHVRIAVICVALFCTISCWRTLPGGPNSNVIPLPRVTENENRASDMYSDAFVGDLINLRLDEAYQKMDSPYVSEQGRTGFDATLDRVANSFGELTSCERKKTDWLQGLEQEQQFSKVWYSCETSQVRNTRVFLVVDVIHLGNRMSVSNFSVLVFPVDIPPDIQ